ncbi:myeloid differentiation primary response protein MyD88 isoform X2 [Musca domestica]|uniref:Myeloid differentiation primary response protein MyD88 isoform X2 n=1 Tax=Musca domestica TaxID=7370 RepID=A0ABM3VBG7_MUSDO|nr:myeloid differentiation primary response protein MyD88 isoform X2 [Musca domestica]
MVMNLTLSISNIHRSNMSINSSASSIESPSSPSGGITFQDVPLSELSKGSMKKLSHLMNSKKILRSEEGYERDWRGLALLAKQKTLCDENSNTGDDPMNKVIQLWCKNNPNTATFANLEKFLGIIDRWDVCDDIYENLCQDTKLYQTKIQQNDNAVESCDNSFDLNDDFGQGSDPNILTTDDVIRAKKGLPPQRYDAFVLYADTDLTYVTEMLTKLEDNSEYNFKLCIKDRDLLAGVAFKHVALTKLIEERCRYLIVLLTNSFLKSAENKFFVDFTQALQIEHKTRKIIPLLYENIDIPRTLNIYTHLRYSTTSLGFCDYWAKLANSIRTVNMVVENSTNATAFKKDMHSTPLTPSRPMSAVTPQKTACCLPSPPTDIPSISINGEAVLSSDNGIKTTARPKSRAFTLRHNKSAHVLKESSVLRNAHSTGQLYTSYDCNNAASMSNISTSSEKKKKKKLTKILSKVFSRSNSRLQQQQISSS